MQLGIFYAAIAYILWGIFPIYFKALQSGPSSRVAPIDKLSVVLVVLLAALFLRESLTLKVGIGAVLITAGAILMAV